MTVAALEAKLAKDTPPPSYEGYDLLNSPEFKVMCDRKILLDAQKKATEEELKALSSDIESLLTAEGVEKVLYRDGYQVKIGRGKSPDKLSATRLVEQGVSLDVIANATEEGKPYTFAQIVAPKAAKA